MDIVGRSDSLKGFKVLITDPFLTFFQIQFPLNNYLSLFKYLDIHVIKLSVL